MKQETGKHLWKRCVGLGLSLAMAVTALPAIPAKAEEAELLKAGSINVTETSVTQGQPFAAKTAGSFNFRIPAMIATKNGSLLAAADARYQTTGDGGGLDTIASMSTDGGQTWKYSFPLFFPDSDGYAGTDATTIIDPVLVQDQNGTVYCMADVNPTGVTTMGGYTAPNVGTGYITVDGKERLALTSDYANVNETPTAEDTETYEYYVGDWNEEGFAPVMNRAGGASEYAVDKWYNLYSVEGGEYVADLTQAQVNNAETQIQQNAFYRDSELHVYNTGYIMYAKSTDDGLTWGDPEILNPQIKRPEETGLLVSPGKGLLVSDGTIVIPFYEHGIGEENASIIWSDDNGATWSRSNDVPGSDNGGFWSSESEVVELNDGTLRMFFRSGEGTVCYADAVRNDSGDYEFAAPKRTTASCTSTCNVSASLYSKEIDGKQAILVSMPGGSGRANGKVFTFLVDEQDGNSMTLKNTFSVPHSSNAFQYSCMAELPDASIGLLWENGGASIRYDNFNIFDLAPNGYIPGAEIDLELYAGETYTREYTAEVAQIQQEPDPSVATLQIENSGGEEKTVIPLYPHTGTSVNGSLSSFSDTADDSLDIADAEWTFTAAEGENTYAVYNKSINKYLVNTQDTNGTITFADTAGNGIEVVKEGNQDNGPTFRLKSGGTTRYVIFFLTNMNYDAMGSYNPGEQYKQYKYDLVLLEKQDAVSEDDVIPGYKVASEVTSGKNYLITYPFGEGDAKRSIVFWPASGGSQSDRTKMLGEVKTVVNSATRKLTITGVGEGQTTAVIDDMTYHINCLGNRKINLVPGEKYFIEGAQEYESANEQIASIETGTESRKALFDCEHVSNNNLDGYSQVPNWDIDMAGAEFIVDSPEDGLYTIYSPIEEVYLENANASSYFGSLEITHSLSPSMKDGITSFEIMRVSDDNLNNRYVYFFYEKMAFDAVSIKEGFESRGDFGFEFLEKSDTITNLDPIPGYRLASEIVPGKSYLITEYYGDGIIVLYPRNGIENQSKLYQSVDVDGIYITARGKGQKTTVTVDGVVYDVIIGQECPHNGTTYKGDVLNPTCEEPGYTGNTYCSICREKLKDGTVSPATGHDYDWDNAEVTKEVTTTEDGVLTATCKNDSNHTTTRPISSYDFVKSELANALVSAKAKAAQTDVYTETTIAELNQAIAAAEALAENASQDAYNEALTNLLAAEGALVTKELQNNLDELNGLLSKEYEADKYTTGSFAILETALAEGRELLADGNYTVRTLERAIKKINDAISGLVTLEEEQLQKDLEAVNTELDKQFEDVQKLLANPSAYSPETFKILQDAYNKALALRNDDKIQADKNVAALKEALAGVKAAVGGLKPPASVENPPAQKVAAPSIQSVSASAGKDGVAIKVTVNAVTGASKYAVYRVAGGKTALVGNTASGQTAVTDTKNTSRKVSYYAVALDAAGNAISDKGASKSLTLEKGINVKKVSSAKSGITVTWKKAKKAKSYIIYRSTKKNGSYTKVGSVKKNKTSFKDKKVSKGKSYYYKIVIKTKNSVSLMGKASKKVKSKK